MRSYVEKKILLVINSAIKLLMHGLNIIVIKRLVKWVYYKIKNEAI